MHLPCMQAPPGPTCILLPSLLCLPNAVLAVVQLGIGLARPGLSDTNRPQWRLLHYWWGRAASLLGLLDVILGVVLIHDVQVRAVM
jgi:hypothetical protein